MSYKTCLFTYIIIIAPHYNSPIHIQEDQGEQVGRELVFVPVDVAMVGAGHMIHALWVGGGGGGGESAGGGEGGGGGRGWCFSMEGPHIA